MENNSFATSDPQAFPEFLLSLRKNTGLTLKQVSQRVKIAYSMICMWERGNSVPSDDTLIKLAKLYNFDFAELQRLRDIRKNTLNLCAFTEENILGLVLRGLRGQHRMTCKDVTAATGIAASMLAGWESGKTIPNNNSLKKLAAIYACDAEWLYRLREQGQRASLPPHPEKTESLSKLLVSLRKKRLLTQGEAALMLGIPQGMLSFWETGRNTPQNDSLRKLSDFYEYDFEKLKALAENKRRNRKPSKKRQATKSEPIPSIQKDYQTLSSVLISLRLNKEIFQKDVARYIGASVGAVSMWEQGKYLPSDRSLKKLASLYNVDIGYLRNLKEKQDESRSSTKNEFSKTIIRLRNNLNLNQQEVGERLGLRAHTIHRWESGIVFPSDNHIKNLAVLYGCDFVWLESLCDRCKEASQGTLKTNVSWTLYDHFINLRQQNPKLLAGQLASLRQEKHFSQRYVAAKIGVTPPTISLWETGKSVPSESSLKKLAAIYGFGEVPLKSEEDEL